MHVPLRPALLALLLAGCSQKAPDVEVTPPRPVSVAKETAEAPATVPEAPSAITGPVLVAPALDLILESEVGSEDDYNRIYIHPTDGGGGDSGVTISIGYDYGYVKQSRALLDWQALPQDDNHRLAATAGLSGPAARARLTGLRDISIPWQIAIDEFQVVDVPRYWQECTQAFPGFGDLRPNAQGAILSLVYNRGSSTVGPSRVDFRTLRTAIANEDYDGMAAAVRHMLVTMRAAWQSAGILQGMTTRRNKEADLILTP